MFTETLASRVARLEDALNDASDRVQAATNAVGESDAHADYNVRKLALLKVEQALILANF